MEIGKGTLTALISAYGRAYHSLYVNPKIFDDFLAKAMMTEETFGFIGKSMAKSLDFFDPEYAAKKPGEADALSFIMKVHSTPITLSRSRYSEDFLESAMEMGFTQYVILGAGMDTFVFRRPDLATRLQVYELDQLVTQEYKKNRLKELGWEIPPQLHLLTVDFTKDNPAEILINAGLDPKKRTLFSWLGVTYYLDKEAILSTLCKLSEVASSDSVIIFDYLDLNAFQDNTSSVRVRKMREIVKMAGEPMKSGFEPSLLEKDLAEIGIQVVEDLDPDKIQKFYFSNRKDGYTALEHFHIANIRVI